MTAQKPLQNRPDHDPESNTPASPEGAERRRQVQLKLYTRKPGRSGQGTIRRGGAHQLTTCLDAETLDRLNRLASRNGLSTSALIRELTKTGLKLAETGNPWRDQ